MKCEVLFVRVNQIDPDSPEQLVLHQFTQKRNFSVTVPLLLGFNPNSSNFIAMVNLARNKRAYISYAEFFIHSDFRFPNYLRFKNYFIVNYDKSEFLPPSRSDYL